MGRNGSGNHKFIEKWAGEWRLVAGERGDLAESVMSFLETQCAKFAEALFAKGRQVDGSADGQQRLIGADIGSGALTADLLLTRFQRQHIPGFFVAAPLYRLSTDPAPEQAHISA